MWQQFDPDKLRELSSAFKEGGTITAGNSSSINDGAAVLVLASAAFAEEGGFHVLARIRGFGDAEQVSDRCSGGSS
jgi:acetyl-CoA C-acetyltransferase